MKKSKAGYKPARVTLEAAAKKKRENACLIIENKTGFIGNIFDVMDKFNLDKSHIYKLCKRKEPIKYGPNEGLDFKKYTL